MKNFRVCEGRQGPLLVFRTDSDNGGGATKRVKRLSDYQDSHPYKVAALAAIAAARA